MNYLDFHYQLMKSMFTTAERRPIKILDMTEELRRHKTKKWKIVPISAKIKIINHQTACWANIHEITRFDIETNKWAGFSYHYFITRKGYVMKANLHTEMCYHAKGANYDGIGIALEGRLYALKCDGIEMLYSHSGIDKDTNAEKIDIPTRKQLISLIRLWDYLIEEVRSLSIENNLGHCNISPRSRCCDPGDAVMTLLKVYKYVRLKTSNLMGGSQ